MKRSAARSQLPIALTIAGSDSGGGAGIQADLKTFTALGCHGTTAITCITAQNPRAVTGIQPIRADLVRKQIEAVFAELPPRAVKTGMLFSADIINVVADFFAKGKCPPLIVDPVMVATSGAVLLKPSAIHALKERLLPLATLVKGGHLKLGGDAMDVLFDGKRFTVLKARRIPGVSTHGTGCTYSAAVTSYLAQGEKLPHAVALAKRFITRAIAWSYLAAGHTVLHHTAGGGGI